jgi:hypothetical protein
MKGRVRRNDKGNGLLDVKNSEPAGPMIARGSGG